MPLVCISIIVLPPDTGERGLDFLLEAGKQFAVGIDQRLLGFDLDDDGLLRGDKRVLILRFGLKDNERKAFCVQQ